MIQESMFNIPYWTLPTLNFSEKKKKLQALCKRHPESKHGIQTFSTNRQSPRMSFFSTSDNIFNSSSNITIKSSLN